MSPFTLTRAMLLESRMISAEYGKPAALFPRKVLHASLITDLMQACLLPSPLAICKVKAHTKDRSFEALEHAWQAQKSVEEELKHAG
ncbi:hypothetical protein QTP86_003676, partial [Hemibagrus guttatus]